MIAAMTPHKYGALRLSQFLKQASNPSRALHGSCRLARHVASSERAAVASLSTTSTGNQDSRVHGRAWSTSLMVAVALASSASIIGATSHSNQPAFTEAKAENDDDGTDETTTILNWSGTHSVTLPQKSYYEPESIQDLVDIVSEAYKKSDNENKIHIRPIGSALSPNGIAFSSQGMVSLSNLDKILEINKDKLEITVQAGARVSQVLDALRPHGLTLPNLASIAEQQIGGFVSVGAHGTGAKIPPVDEFVTALTLVTPSKHGVVRMTEKTHGELFRLARLGLGGLGILSEVTLKVVPAHNLLEQTIVLTRDEAKNQLNTLLKRHKHVRYMWIPYEDAVVVVTNDDENDLPLLGPGTEVSDGKGGKKKIASVDDVTPKFSRNEQLAPLRDLLRNLLRAKEISIEEEIIERMGFGDLRDLILAYGNMLDPDHIKKCNKAEKDFWMNAQGLDLAPSEKKLNFDCGGQQWVYEVCFPVGTYGMPNEKSMSFMEELLKEIESNNVPAPAPIEQRWTSGSKSPLSPASVITGKDYCESSYEANNALFSWVGVIMYLPSEDLDPTGYRRDFITESFKDQYCKLVRKVGSKYGLMCHWAKLEIPNGEDEEVIAQSVRDRFGPRVCEVYNKARDMYDPKRLLSNQLIAKVFGGDDVE